MEFQLIKAVTDELSGIITGAKVSKIYQPHPEMIVFKLRARQQTVKLLLSSEGQKNRLHLTEQEWLNPSQPPRFCQLLRSRISRIDQVNLVNDDRVVQLRCDGLKGSTTFMLELTGRFSNMILLNDQGEIIDLLKRVEGDGVRRTLLPGEPYSFPIKKDNQKNNELAKNVDRGALTWSHYVEKLYTEEKHSENKQDFKVVLQKSLTGQRKKLKKRLKNITAEHEKHLNFEQDKQIGELILVNLYQINKGMTTITLENYYEVPEKAIEIALDPLLNPQENAEAYFKRYKKARRGLEHSRRRLQETQADLDWIEQLDYQLNDSVKNSDIDDIAQELRAAGLLKEQNRLHARRTQPLSKMLETRSPSGLRILWGRNNRQNDEISTRLLKKGDLWFHVYQAPGSHVVLKGSESPQLLSDADIMMAGSIAAGYSKKRHDSKVEVMQAGAGEVGKLKGARPGLVKVKFYTTIWVKPLRPL